MGMTKISKKLLNRLIIYLEYLKSLPENTVNISASAIAHALGLGDVQVRKDLAKVSDSGRRKTGRNRLLLIREIEEYLDAANETGTIVVGVGHLGRSLLDYCGFEEFGLNILAGFDLNSKAKLSESGKSVYPINHLESFCKLYDVQIGIISVPAERAQKVCDRLVACGVKAIWNFAPVTLEVPEYVVVQSENLAISLSSLRMQIKYQNSHP